MNMKRNWHHFAVGALVLSLLAPCGADIPDYDFQWATIGDAGNPAWMQPSSTNPVRGSGSVEYEYRVSKMEITSAQWLEFLNTIGPLDPELTSENLEPLIWGGRRDFAFPDGYHYRYRSDAPVPALVPLNGITWRAAAMYCNWLHNDKTPALWAIQSGAYDTSTFGFDPETGDLTDQHTRSPGAKFWIPSLGEWTKAAHYDPNRYGQGRGGYWIYPTTSDAAPIPGRPGEPGAQTSAAVPYINDFDLAEFIPLGSYLQTTSPWGLLDTSGGASEYTEYWAFDSRLMRGSDAGGFLTQDRISSFSSAGAFAPFGTLRIASAIPAPHGATLFVAGIIHISSRRRRSCGDMASFWRSSA